MRTKRLSLLTYGLFLLLIRQQWNPLFVACNQLSPPPPPPPRRSINEKDNLSSTTESLETRSETESDEALKPKNKTRQFLLNENDGETASKNLVRLTETEIFDGTKWRAPGSIVSLSENRKEGETPTDGRWSVLDGLPKDASSCLPPAKQKAPKGYSWDGDWKILTSTSTRDSFGWEYSHGRGPYPTRQRIWLRTIVIHEKASASSLETPKSQKSKSKASSSTSKEISIGSSQSKKSKRKHTHPSKRASSKLTKRKQRKLPRWMKSVADDFNFRGFAVSIWKGVVFPKSIGVTFRLPLTQNFNRWDGTPALPSASVSLALFYPALVALNISGNFRLPWLKWCFFQTYSSLQYLMLYLIWTFYRGLLLAMSAVVFPVTRKLINPPLPIQPPWVTTPGPAHRRDVDERVGCSYSWRVSPERGFYTAFRVWHYCAPTLTSVWKHMEQVSSGQKWLPDMPEMPAWIARHAAEIGFDISAPLDDEPYFSGSTGLCLSGFYLKPRESIRFTTTSTLNDYDEEEMFLSGSETTKSILEDSQLASRRPVSAKAAVGSS